MLRISADGKETQTTSSNANVVFESKTNSDANLWNLRSIRVPRRAFRLLVAPIPDVIDVFLVSFRLAYRERNDFYPHGKRTARVHRDNGARVTPTSSAGSVRPKGSEF